MQKLNSARSGLFPSFSLLYSLIPLNDKLNFIFAFHLLLRDSIINTSFHLHCLNNLKHSFVFHLHSSDEFVSLTRNTWIFLCMPTSWSVCLAVQKFRNVTFSIFVVWRNWAITISHDVFRATYLSMWTVWNFCVIFENVSSANTNVWFVWIKCANITSYDWMVTA